MEKNAHDKSRLPGLDVSLGLIWSLIWPQMVMVLSTTAIGLTDIWTAGQIDASVQAAIGLTGQVQGVFMVLVGALGAGAMASVSQSFGAGLLRRGQNYSGLVIILAAFMGLIIGGVSWIFRDEVLSLLQVPEELRQLAGFFLGLALLSLPAIYVMMVGGTLFRATRKVKLPLLVSCGACVINVFGDLGFGLGWFGLPAFGAAGIAWTSLVALYVAAVLTVFLLCRVRLFAPGIIPAWRWTRKAAPYLLKVAAPAVATHILWQTGYLLLFVVVSTLPGSVTVLAGMTAGMRVEALLFMPAMAFNVTASILVGNALGAGDKVGAKRVALATGGFGVLLMSIAAGAMWPWRTELAAAFSDSAAVLADVVLYLTYNILSTPFTVASMCLNGVMTGAGATIYALIINPVCIWTVRLPLAWGLAHWLGFGSRGVYLAMMVSMIVQASCMLWVFFRRNWARYAMRQARPANDKGKPALAQNINQDIKEPS